MHETNTVPYRLHLYKQKLFFKSKNDGVKKESNRNKKFIKETKYRCELAKKKKTISKFESKPIEMIKSDNKN